MIMPKFCNFPRVGLLLATILAITEIHIIYYACMASAYLHSITVFLRNYHKHARCFLWLPCYLDIVFSGILVISGIAKLSYLVFNDRYNTVVESVIVLSDSTATFVSITAWVLAGGCKKWHHGLVVNGIMLLGLFVTV